MKKDIIRMELKAIIKEAIREVLEEEGVILRKEQNSSSKEEDDPLLDKSVHTLGLSHRILKILYYNDIDTVGKLAGLSVYDMATWRNFGKKGVEEIEKKLKENNLSLRS